MNTDIKNIIESTSEESQYDEKAKKILGNKHILSQILCVVVDEFKGKNPREVFECIEGEPLISRVPVEPGMTNSKAAGEKIAGFNTEDSENNEGMVRYDVIFYVKTSNGLAQIIINVEAQKDEPTKYSIINRTVFYICRLISSQKNRDFVKQKYDNIRKVYTIWVCMDMDENCMDYIHLTDEKILGSHNWKGRLDLLNIILIGLGNEIPGQNEEEYRLHRFLGTVFSDKLSSEEKINVMENEYNVPMTQELKEDLDDMCNLSKGLVEKAEARGEARGEMSGEARGIIQTAQEYGETEAAIIKKVQEKLHITSQQAQAYFGIYGKNTV